MKAVYGAEHAELHPAGVKLIVLFAMLMAADIVTPPGVPDI